MEVEGNKPKLIRDEPWGQHDRVRGETGSTAELHLCQCIHATWWDNLCDWIVAMDGHKLFRRDRQGRRGCGLALCAWVCFKCLEPSDSDSRVACLWLRIRERANKADILVGVL